MIMTTIEKSSLCNGLPFVLHLYGRGDATSLYYVTLYFMDENS